jgi:hypothetical protein
MDPKEMSAVRAEQARRWLHQARDEAAAIGEGGLVEQADRRLADLDRIAGPDGA